MSLRFFRLLHRRGFSRKKLRQTLLGGWLGDHLLAKELWRLERESLARAVAIGLFMTLTPFWGAQIALAVVCALVFRAHIPVAAALQFISNPLTGPFIYPPLYLVGCWMLGFEPIDFGFWMELVKQGDLAAIWEAGVREAALLMFPLLLGCTVAGVVVGAIGYGAVHFFWKERTSPQVQPRL